MRRPPPRPSARDERGATLAIVAISLIVFLGMLVLTMDLGWLVANRRTMVQTSDSAALAAAQACAGQEAAAGGSGVAEPRADQYALQNDGGVNAGESNIIAMQGCGTESTGFVRVRYERQYPLFFAPIFGQRTGTVSTVATAEWGPAGGARTVAPIRLDLQTVVPCIVEVGTRCTFGFDNTSEETRANSQWGWLNFPQGWNRTPPCPSQSGGTNQLRDLINGTQTFDPVLNNPAPTYACSATGESVSLVQAVRSYVGELLTFPVVDTETWPVLVSGNNLESFPVVGFTVLRVVGAWWGQQAKQHCPNLAEADSANVFCIELEYAGPQSGGTIPAPDEDVPDLGLRAVRLTE